jgi:hypothetical protein
MVVPREGKVLGMITHPLPKHEDLDVEALGRIFNDTTNSYKLFFFRSILSLVEKGRFQGKRRVTLEEIALGMITAAWAPSAYYRLSLGPRDQLAALISNVEIDVAGLSLVTASLSGRLQRKIEDATPHDQVVSILRFVPYRLLRPFFEAETTGLADYKVNEAIHRCAHASFRSRKPAPYILIEGQYEELEMHAIWFEYISRHLKILSEWADWHLADYLQRRNPNTPAIMQKLRLPRRRSSLMRQQKIWRVVMAKEKIHCLYTNETLASDSHDLDHFLPWSFVCHDELWNLIPVAKSANSSKGNCIPSKDYMKPFIDLQFRSLVALKAAPEWDSVWPSYSAGLRLTESELTNKESVERSFHETMSPLATLANRMGFTGNWKYQCPEA